MRQVASFHAQCNSTRRKHLQLHPAAGAGHTPGGVRAGPGGAPLTPLAAGVWAAESFWQYRWARLQTLIVSAKQASSSGAAH